MIESIMVYRLKKLNRDSLRECPIFAEALAKLDSKSKDFVVEVYKSSGVYFSGRFDYELLLYHQLCADLIKVQGWMIAADMVSTAHPGARRYTLFDDAL